MDNVKKYISNFSKYKNLLKELVFRDIKIKYRRSVLGILWSLLNPLFMMIIITVVFSSVFKSSVANFPVYFLTGQIIFAFYSEATTAAMSSILGSGSLIKKVYIPKYIFPFAKVLSSFVNLGFSLIAVIIMIVVTKVKITWTILLIPVPLLCILFFALGVGMILAAYTVFFRDLMHLYGVFLTALMYWTPMFYPIEIIPENIRFLLELNPLYHIITYFRQVVLYGQVPSLRLTFICVFVSIYTFLLGTYLFYKKQNEFILYV